MEVFSNKVARSTFGACTPRNKLSRSGVRDYMINFSNFSHLSSTLLTLTPALWYIQFWSQHFMHDDSAWDTWVCDIYKIYRLQDRARTGGKYHARQREKVKKSVRSSPRSLWCCARGRILRLSALHNISLSPCAHRQHSLAYVRAQIDRTVTPSSCAGAITSTALAHTHTREVEKSRRDRAYKCLSASRLNYQVHGEKVRWCHCIYLSTRFMHTYIYNAAHGV